MIREIEISTMNDLFEMISEQEYRVDLGRHRNLFIYRGEPNASYTLSLSLPNGQWSTVNGQWHRMRQKCPRWL